MSADPGPMTFGLLVRRHRERLLLTQEELAERSGLSIRAISYLESGRVRRPRAASVRILAEALALSETDRTEFRTAATHLGATTASKTAVASRRAGAWGPIDGAEPAADEPEDGAGTDRVAGGVAVARGTADGPVELPPVAGAFVGRDADLDRLDRLIGDESRTHAKARVVLLTGTAGVGKTALAVRWARQAASQFPDGRLFVDLHGFSPGRPMSAATALGLLIRALDPATGLPHELAARTARLRTLVNGRRLLIVLDNARSVDQVRALLPGSESCAVLVTSRNDLGGLVIRDGVSRLSVARLTTAAGSELLSALAPEPTDAAGADEVAGLLDRCAHLPLAIRIAAEILVQRSDLSVAALGAALADESRRLDLLGVEDDPETGVREVLSWSYQLLDPGAARAFELIGAQPCVDLDPAAAAALLETSPEQCAEVVGRLARANLVDRDRTTGRIGAHDLLRAYAHQLIDPVELDAAIGRLADHQLSVAGRCVDVLYPHASQVRSGADEAPGDGPADAESAAAWLDRERENLLVLSGHPALAQHAVEFSDLLWRYLFTRGFYAEAAQLHRHAMRVASARGDRRGEALATRHLAGVRMRTGDYTEALELTDRALRLHTETGDDRAAGAAHNLRGVLFERTGRPVESLAAYRQAHAVAERTGDELAIASTLNNIGCLLDHAGRLDEAAEHLERALAVRRRINDRPGEGLTLGNLAGVHRRAGRFPEAFDVYEQAIAVAREVGERNDEAFALGALADALRLVGRFDDARERHAEALAIARETGNKPIEVAALNGLAEIEEESGRFAAAIARYDEVLVLTRRLGERLQEARALAGAGRSRRELGETEGARDLLTAALDLYESLDSTEAADVSAALHALG